MFKINPDYIVMFLYLKATLNLVLFLFTAWSTAFVGSF